MRPALKTAVGVRLVAHAAIRWRTWASSALSTVVPPEAALSGLILSTSARYSSALAASMFAGLVPGRGLSEVGAAKAIGAAATAESMSA